MASELLRAQLRDCCRCLVVFGFVKKRRNDGATGATNTRCAASCWRDFGQVPTAATVRDRYPEPPCGNLLPLDLLGLRVLGDSHNCRTLMFRRTCGRMPGATQSVRRELFGQQRT